MKIMSNKYLNIYFIVIWFLDSEQSDFFKFLMIFFPSCKNASIFNTKAGFGRNMDLVGEYLTCLLTWINI